MKRSTHGLLISKTLLLISMLLVLTSCDRILNRNAQASVTLTLTEGTTYKMPGGKLFYQREEPRFITYESEDQNLTLAWTAEHLTINADTYDLPEDGASVVISSEGKHLVNGRELEAVLQKRS